MTDLLQTLVLIKAIDIVLNSLLFNIISPIARSRLRFIDLIISIYRLLVIIIVEFNSWR
jgi:hypothetical protein